MIYYVYIYIYRIGVGGTPWPTVIVRQNVAHAKKNFCLIIIKTYLYD